MNGTLTQTRHCRMGLSGNCQSAAPASRAGVGRVQGREGTVRGRGLRVENDVYLRGSLWWFKQQCLLTLAMAPRDGDRKCKLEDLQERVGELAARQEEHGQRLDRLDQALEREVAYRHLRVEGSKGLEAL